MRFLLTSILLFVAPISSWAAITFSNISNASNHTIDSSNKLTLYAGIVGSATAGECASATTSVCDNCENTSTTFTACNERRVLSTTQLSLTLKSSSVTSGDVEVQDEDGNSTINLVESATVSGGQATIKIEWSEICGEFGDASCASSASGTIKIGINSDADADLEDVATVEVVISTPSEGDINVSDCDANNGEVGICGVTLFAGDEKVFIEEVEKPSGWPNVGETKFSKIRAFIGEGQDPDGSTYFDLGIVDDGESLENNRVEGLSNDTEYFFRFASIDEAGNIAYYTDVTEGYTPSEVVGLLEEDMNCFIATAAYGSSLHPHLNTFRQFRNQILLKTSLGRKFVKTYYKYGPMGARAMIENRGLRLVVRFALWPVWLATWLLLNPLVSLILVGIALYLLGWVLKPRREIKC